MKSNSKNTLIFIFACLIAIVALPPVLKLTAKFVSNDIQMVIVLGLIVWGGYWFLRSSMKMAFEESDEAVQDGENETENTKLSLDKESAYFILGVDPRSSGEEIRRAYRALARQHHPDHFSDADKTKASLSLTRIHRAHQVVGNSDARFDYEMYVKSCWPGFPSLDEAYAFIQDRRKLVGDTLEEVERNNETTPERELDESPRPSAQGEDPAPDVRVDAPELVREVSTNAAGSNEPSQPPLQESTMSGECPACGEAYFIAQGRGGPIHCERCGMELFRLGS